jgi:hypothetical protein
MAWPSAFFMVVSCTVRLPAGWMISIQSPTAKRFLVSTSAQPSATAFTSPTNWLRVATEWPVS